MKKRTKWLIMIIALLVIGVSITYLYSYRGICFEHTGGFQWAEDSTIFNDIFPERHSASISMVDVNRGFGIRRIFWFFLLAEPPHGILINIDDESKTMRWIVVKTVTVDYGNGNIYSRNVDFEEGFKVSRTTKLDEDGEDKDVPVMSLSAKIHAVVDKNKSCTIKMNGYFVDSDDNKIPFETNNFFEYEAPYWRVYTGVGAFAL